MHLSKNRATYRPYNGAKAKRARTLRHGNGKNKIGRAVSCRSAGGKGQKAAIKIKKRNYKRINYVIYCRYAHR